MFETCKIDWMLNPTIKHYSGGAATFYTTRKRWLVFKITKVWLTSAEDFDFFTEYMIDFQDEGSFTLEIVIDTDLNKLSIKGNESWAVAMPKNGIKDMQKYGFENEDIYQIGTLLLEQVG